MPAADDATETFAPQQQSPATTDPNSRPKRHWFVPARNPLVPGRAGNLPLQSTELPAELRPTYRDPADVRAQENLARPNPRVVIPDELPLPNREPADPKPQPRTYTVRHGDSLEKIAVRFYGNAAATQRIFAANRDRLNQRNYLPEGMTIVLP
jgi:nucleoid-associated protein YgaU